MPRAEHVGADAPLPQRLRPRNLSEVIGQPGVLGPDGTLTALLMAGHLPSLILWGPPGCGKTTIARLLAAEIGAALESVSAIASGVADLKQAFEMARLRRQQGKRTLLFVDEIHRFNRAQQDALLGVVEDGTVILVGATTENPSFALNSALLSRGRVIVLSRLDEAALGEMLARAEELEGKVLPLTEEARGALCAMADGDGRFLLNMAEGLLMMPTPPAPMDAAQLARWAQRRPMMYDKTQDEHYNLISALHKSLRGSDVQAALYWFSRMLEGGEDPRYIARRMIRFASEDIGLADPAALPQAIAGLEAYEMLGTPEGELALAQVVIYLATAPKSNAAYMAYKAVRRDAEAHGSLPPPKHILNAPTKLMKNEGYGKGYAYDHDAPDGFSGQNYFPSGLERRDYYQPKERGFEREIQKRLDYWDKLREKRKSEGGDGL
jgi:putative ATPase